MVEELVKKRKKEFIGVVTSNKMEKTIVVAIKKRIKHPVYGKVINKTKKVKVHDPKNECLIGDNVKIIETRPLSKDKRWCLLDIISRDKKVSI